MIFCNRDNRDFVPVRVIPRELLEEAEEVVITPTETTRKKVLRPSKRQVVLEQTRVPEGKKRSKPRISRTRFSKPVLEVVQEEL